jgi:SAM-dependent methyltransferase
MKTDIEPRAMALRGVHEGVLRSVQKCIPPDKSVAVLDVGAGQGALSKRLHESGYTVYACGLDADNFVYDPVEFRAADGAECLPYDDGAFDVVVAAELIEHLLDQMTFFKESHRVLKPGGGLIISTPNILSMKSRLQYFSSGYFWSFDPLDMNDRSGLQHVTGRSVEQYQYMALQNGLYLSDLGCDKYQNTSKALLIFYPLMYLAVRTFKSMQKNIKINNTLELMLSRVVIMTFKKR